MRGGPEKKVFGLAAVILLLVGVPLFWMGVRNVWRGLASTGWPVTEGVVRAAEIVAKDEVTSAEIAVEYGVGGMKYTTDTLHFGQTLGSSDSSEAEMRAMRYAAGRRVWVRYDPTDPGIACTEPGFSGEALLLPAAGLAFGLPGVVMLVLAMSVMKESMWKWGLWLFAAVFGGIGVALLWVGLTRVWLAHESAQWPVVDAEIVYAQEDTSTTYKDSMRRRGPTSTSYATNLVFRYEVNGSTRYSNLRRIGQLAGADEDWADEIAERYPKGKKLQVRYRPQDPDVAVIEAGIGGEAFWLPGAGAAFLLFSLLVAKFGIPALTREM
ncbi:MAG: DUF3592 domain-containing protein [Bryobacterales bacterium]|nr:DUF3592 domain-containing protein [Bryobacterales bacterium]